MAAILGNELQWSDAESVESTIFRAIAGREPSAAEADLLRAIFVSCVDHTPATPSSLAAITSYSGGNLLKTSLAAGITAMGESHAGAGEGTARILLEYADKLRRARRLVRGRRRAGRRLEGLGRLHHQQSHRRLRRREGQNPRLRPPLLRPLRPRSPRRRTAEHRKGIGPGRRVLHAGRRKSKRS